MAAVWFILTIPTEQHQLNVSAQQSAVDKDKEKVEANRHHVVTFQAVSTPLLNREKQEQEKKQEQEQEQEQEAEQENKPKQQLTRESLSKASCLVRPDWLINRLLVSSSISINWSLLKQVAHPR